MNARTTVSLSVLLSLVLLVMGMVGAQGEPAFRIGILDAPDGPLASGAQLAINQINAAGGIRGADGQQYRFDAVIQGPDIQGALATAIGNLTNAGVVAVVDKLIKQRRDSVEQYLAAGRQDLADRERYEIEVLSAYLPQPLSNDELAALIRQAIAETGATSARDMGKVMAWIKPRAAGRADMSALSAQVKQALS